MANRRSRPQPELPAGFHENVIEGSVVGSPGSGSGNPVEGTGADGSAALGSSGMGSGSQAVLTEERPDPGSVGLARLLAEYDIVDSGETADGGQYLVTAPRVDQYGEPVIGRPSAADAVSMMLYEDGVRSTALGETTVDAALVELGSAAPSPWTSALRQEHLFDLRGKRGLQTYLKMKRSDPDIRAALHTLKTPIWAARWFFEAGEDTTQAKRQVEFLTENFFGNRMNTPWSRVLEDALLAVDYGYMPMEKVHVRDGGKIWLRKLAPRHPLDVEGWEYDANGGPTALLLEPSMGGTTVGPDGTPSYLGAGTPVLDHFHTPHGPKKPVRIPIEKLVVITMDSEAGDLRGTSVLRSAYKPWMIKDTLLKIDAIQKERHGIGVPVIKLPPTFNDNDKRLANEIGRNLRTNERAHVVLPPFWELEFAKLEGQPVDAMKSIEYYTERIFANILACGLDNDRKYDLFLKSTRYIAATVADAINRYVVPELIDFNWANTKHYPKLSARWIGEFDDMRTRSFAVRNYVGAGIIRPDDDMEDQIRKELDLPLRDPDTDRTIVAPQLPGDQQLDPNQYPGVQGAPAAGTPGAPGTPAGAKPAGAPQAGKPTPGGTGGPRQTAPKAKLPKGNSGTDRSGG